MCQSQNTSSDDPAHELPILIDANLVQPENVHSSSSSHATPQKGRGADPPASTMIFAAKTPPPAQRALITVPKLPISSGSERGSEQGTQTRSKSRPPHPLILAYNTLLNLFGCDIQDLHQHTIDQRGSNPRADMSTLKYW